MSLLNKFFGIKREVPNVSSAPTPVINETVDQDGYVHLNSTIESQQVHHPVPLPYEIRVQSTPQNKQDTSSNSKPSDEIPFQFSPAYSKIWSTTPYTRKQARKLKDIDWDSLCYDFKLEKSIIQS